jgi:DNA-binding response OmpR family regulator
VDGFSALREIRQEIPNILLSDLNMPGMSGFELLLVVRRRFPAIQVVAMSGAFSGIEVPSGIPADAFYQKGSSVTALLHIFRALPQMKRRAPAPPRTGSPLWIQHRGNDSTGKACVTVTCPECLRTSLQALEDTRRLIREVDCIHCGSSIQYAIVEPSDQMKPQGFRHTDHTTNTAQSASDYSD